MSDCQTICGWWSGLCTQVGERRNNIDIVAGARSIDCWSPICRLTTWAWVPNVVSIYKYDSMCRMYSERRHERGACRVQRILIFAITRTLHCARLISKKREQQTFTTTWAPFEWWKVKENFTRVHTVRPKRYWLRCLWRPKYMCRNNNKYYFGFVSLAEPIYLVCVCVRACVRRHRRRRQSIQRSSNVENRNEIRANYRKKFRFWCAVSSTITAVVECI